MFEEEASEKGETAPSRRRRPLKTGSVLGLGGTARVRPPESDDFSSCHQASQNCSKKTCKPKIVSWLMAVPID